jgi:hypothetical protein
MTCVSSSGGLPNWGLTAADENSVIDGIDAEVAENLSRDVSGVLGRGLNGDYTITGHAGDFQIEILNSRDNPNPYGLYPNVSQVIVGGTLAELLGEFIGNVVRMKRVTSLGTGIRTRRRPTSCPGADCEVELNRL